MDINLILDIIVVGILILGCIIGAKKGMVYQILSLASFVVSFIVAKIASKAIAAWAYTNFIKEKIELIVSDKITSLIPAEYLQFATTDNIKESLAEILKDIPTFISDMINLETIDYSLISLESIPELSATIVSVVLAPVIIILISHVVFLILFIVLTLLFKLLIKVTNIVKKIPLIKTANKWIGAILGVATYGVVLTIGIQIFSLLLTLNGTGSFLGISEEIIESTYLFKLLYNIMWFFVAH